ncbi:metallophosphoesterase [Tumebacillus sp. DT12]|uniref:Metallophosphoesterase n=1 Tax=Tumebacillus lacus TaxID=2995335 RepID=A0ABT3X6F6_9BACL|nr:metallophosphoesterase [Tumebacillus lacus]MCX7571432.1 metallophosphoesterase [Tumebacillus lacus]
MLKTIALMAALAFQSAAIPATTVPAIQPELRFPVISDTHVQSWDTRSQTKFKQALTDLHNVAPKSDAMVITGDLGNGQPADYAALSAILSGTPHPAQTLFTIGNHEFYKAWMNTSGQFSEKTFPNGETEQASITRFLHLTGESKVYYERWIKGYHFLVLGSEQYRQSNPANLESAWLSSGQLHWLKEELKEKKEANRPIFVFLHQPIEQTVQGEELRAILAEHPEVIFFSGHTHTYLGHPNTLMRDQFTRVNTSSVLDPVNGADQQISPEQSEGMVVSVYDDKVVIQGRDFHGKRWIEGAQYLIPLLTPTDQKL